MSEGNYAEMLVDGHRLLPVILEDIAGAERSIHISMFLFFRDPIGDEIADALSRKARAGRSSSSRRPAQCASSAPTRSAS